MARVTLVRTCHICVGPAPAMISHALPPVTVLPAGRPPSASRRGPTFIGCDIPWHHHELRQYSSVQLSSAQLSQAQQFHVVPLRRLGPPSSRPRCGLKCEFS